MEDDHFSHEIIQRFFRSELSRRETRDFVRHLLRRCARCSHLLQQTAQGLSLPVRGRDILGSGSPLDERRGSVRRALRLVEPREPRPDQEGSWRERTCGSIGVRPARRPSWTRILTG